MLHGPMIQDDLAKLFKDTKVHISQRLCRMKKEGYVKVVGSKRTTGNNYNAPVYGVGDEPILPKARREWTVEMRQAAQKRAIKLRVERAKKLLARGTKRDLPDLRMNFVFNMGVGA